MQIRLGIVDDHDLVRDGLAMILAAQPDMEVVGQPVTPMVRLLWRPRSRTSCWLT